nr:immunoglobulin light chain junction region [Macaca mulatta]
DYYCMNWHNNAWVF